MGLLECHPCGPGNWPITSGHRTVNPRRPGHRGSDVDVKRQPLYAAISGTATLKDQPGGAGWYIKITHVSGFYIYYFHMSRRDVKNGDYVRAGQQIGLSGGFPREPGAGRTDGPHLHFEIWQHGVDINPAPHMAEVMHTPLPGGGSPTTPPSGEEDVFDMGTMTKQELKDLMVEVEKETSGAWEQDTRKYMGHTICESDGATYYVDTDGKGFPAKYLIPDTDMFWMLVHSRFLSSGPTFTPSPGSMEKVAFDSLPVRFFGTHGQ